MSWEATGFDLNTHFVWVVMCYCYMNHPIFVHVESSINPYMKMPTGTRYYESLPATSHTQLLLLLSLVAYLALTFHDLWYGFICTC